MGHTPGPWYVGKYGDNDSDVCAEDGPVICALRSGKADPYDMTADADAALIAAAPELLKALRFVLPVLANAARRGTIDEEGVNLELEAAREVTDAIALAEGRE